MNDFKFGYPNLATFKNSSQTFSIYRRFGYLQSRLLLEKQYALRVLERRLEEFDHEHFRFSDTHNLEDDELLPRQALLEEIEHAFNAYGETTTETRLSKQVLDLADTVLKPQCSFLPKSCLP